MMIWIVLVVAGALFVGFLAGLALRPKDLRDLERKLKRSREARDRLHAVLTRATDLNYELQRHLSRQRTYTKFAQLRIDQLKTERDQVRERVDDTVVSLVLWRDMVDRDEYDSDGLPEDLDGLTRQLRIDGTNENETAPALEAGDPS